MFKASVVIDKGGNPTRPTEKAFELFERVDVSGIVRLLEEAEVIDAETKNAAEKLETLRNAYAHARRKEPHIDAIEAIKFLNTLVEGTVLVFKDFEITDRGLAKKLRA